ncbi:sigma-70 family RNA polymerase sigma factor [Nemorincola caseinilytica]|uniref:Sigma-70 family RNA polymerase sigma factor n=1 Tax=Nemorincola caseinilytica TaxID=2054315 RepID=A0ABP8NGL5_9BACT
MPSLAQHTDLSDEQLLAAYRDSRDNRWLGALLQRYTALLLGVGMKYLKDHTLAEDAVQHVFETTLTRLPEGPIANFKGWLYVLMRNHCLQLLRDKRYMADETAIQEVEYSANGVEDAQWLEHSLQQMAEALEQINTEQREAIELFYLQKCSYEQIIERTGFTFMQVKSYIQNGKRNLKAILMKKLGSTEK